MEVKDLVPVDYANQRVLTTRQVAYVYNTTTDRIKDNFRRAKEHFKKGLHYFKVEGEEARTLREVVSGEFFSAPKNALNPLSGGNSFILYTEQGAARHCKMLNTPQAWEMFDKLEKNYFNQDESVVESETVSTAQLAALQSQLDALQAHLEHLQNQFDGVEILFQQWMEHSPVEKVNSLIAIADKLSDADAKDKVLLQAANLLIGKKLF